MKNKSQWLDDVIGCEVFPDAGWFRPDPAPSILGIDKATGGLVITGPPGTPASVMGQIFTQGSFTLSAMAQAQITQSINDPIGRMRVTGI